MASSTKLDDLEPLLEYIKASRGFDFTGYKRPSLQRRVAKRMQAVRCETYERLPLVSRGAPGRVHRALQHDPDQRHDVLPGHGGVGVHAPRDRAENRGGHQVARQHPHLVDGLRIGGGGVLDRYLLRRGRSAGGFSSTREDLRDRHRRGGPRRRAPRDLPELAPRGCPGRSSRALLRPPRTALDRSAAPLRRAVIFGRHDLVQDPPISRIDLLALPEHAHVLHAGRTAADPCELPLRSPARPATCSSGSPR